ncbi:MAG TPA: hypothetical protein VKA53_01050 [Thermoanaerobaculia bacterium]|nr:hypothetical protein [Thermoanaerobaculia bacterium]
MKIRRWPGVAAGCMLAVLAVARATGGAVLLRRGSASVGAVRLAPTSAIAVALGLILVAVLASAAVVGLVVGASWGRWLAVAAVVLFLVGGIVNGTVLFGAPRIRGQLLNFGYSFLVLYFLYLQRPLTHEVSRDEIV